MNRKITLAITVHNRFDLLVKCFEQVIDDSRISEIVIVDDRSDLSYFSQILDKFKDIEKIAVHRNSTNLGVYKNKYESVARSNNDWVIVFDSDNVITKDYLDKLYALPIWFPDVLYSPDFARPTFDYRHFGGRTIDKSNVGACFKEKQFDCLINTMNCFVHRDTYMAVFNPNGPDPVAADSAYFNYLWLNAGNKIYVVPGLEYDHLVHGGSHYVKNIGRSNTFHAKVMSQLKAMK